MKIGATSSGGTSLGNQRPSKTKQETPVYILSGSMFSSIGAVAHVETLAVRETQYWPARKKIVSVSVDSGMQIHSALRALF